MGEKMSTERVNKMKRLFPKTKKPLFREALRQRTKMLKVYNGFCDECRRKCFEDSTRPFEDYCEKCQEMAEKILG